MSQRKKVTIATLREMKRAGERFAMITCYDHATACLMEEAGVHSLLVGDTYAEVCLGHPTTHRVSVEHLVTLCEAVRRGSPSAYLVGDMPFLSYQVSIEDAIRNAGRFIAEAGCDCVKLEVDARMKETVAAIAAAGIPVMAHLGLRPQSIATVGGYRVQGKSAADALRLIEDAKLMEQAGASSLLLEAVPQEVAREITRRTELPVTGIVAGGACDGQVVVLHDMVGYGGGHPPRSTKQYAKIHDTLVSAFRAYTQEVAGGEFPTAEQSPSMDEEQLAALREMLGSPPAA